MRFFLVLFITALAGCASNSTNYQPLTDRERFTEVQLDKNAWKVTFRGNDKTTRQKAEDFLLLRCADLTLKHDFNYFSITNTEKYNETTVYNNDPNGIYDQYMDVINLYSFSSYVITPTYTNLIIMYKEKPNTPEMIYDANFVCQSVGEKYKATCGITNK